MPSFMIVGLGVPSTCTQTGRYLCIIIRTIVEGVEFKGKEDALEIGFLLYIFI